MVHKFAFTTLILVVVFSLTSCSTTGGGDTTAGDSSSTKPALNSRFTVEPGSLVETYLKEPWPSYEHNKNIKGLFYDKGVLLLLSEDNELIKLDLLNGLPYTHKLQLKSTLQFSPVVFHYGLNEKKEGASELYLLQEGDLLWCVEAETLQELWSADLGYGVSCSPTISMDNIVICAEGGRINCIKKDDRSDLWTYSAGKTISASPVVDGDRLFASSEDSLLYSLNANGGWVTGGQSWSAETNARIVTSPIVYKQKIFVASLDRILYMFDEFNGDLLRKYHIGQLVQGQPYACKNTVFFIGEKDPASPRTMYAINATTGKSRWMRKVQGAGDKDFYIDGVPDVGKILTVGKELVYVLSQDKLEILGLRIVDGKIIHKIPLSEEPDFVITHDAEQGRDANNMGLIILGTKEGKILVLKERRLY